MSESNDTETVTKTITNLLLKHSYSLSSYGSNRNRKRKHGVYVRLPDDVKVARSQCKIAFDFWKQDQFSVNSIVHDNYRSKRKDYRLALRNFLNHLEVDRVKKLCAAAETDEKLFWKLLKGQRSSSQMSAFLVNGAFITEENDIRDMWADHFEVLGTPTVSFNFDNEFANSISTHFQNIFHNCINDPTGALNEPLTYEEVAGVCSNLKPGVSGVSLDYEHVGYAGPPLWRLLFHLYQQFYENFSVSKFLKTGIILPFFKGKGARANNKDNYRGITLFPTLCKIYEMILLNRLEKFAADNKYFSELQFGFREGVGCIEASFTILETINHMLERGSKVFSCFLDVRKAFDTVWIDGLLFKLFSELGINGRMWLVIKDLHTNVLKQKCCMRGTVQGN